MIELAESRSYGRLKVGFVCTPFENFESEKAVFDLVFSCMAVHWLDPRVSFSKTATLLKAGGHFVLMNISRSYPPAIRTKLDRLYLDFPEIGDFRPRADVLCEQSISEREKYFTNKGVHSFTWNVDYTPSSYIGLMTTMSPQRSLSSSRFSLYTERLEALLADHPNFTLPNTVSAEILQKR
jgi:SAM-dependent methyltransferase